ncbi:MAG: hypothetical protein IPJ82_01905 [Lewinellaceae bacterium]|nr:hypothetical protein [Lewinellaceae bacterium]
MKSISRIVALFPAVVFGFYVQGQSPCLGVGTESTCPSDPTALLAIPANSTNITFSLINPEDGIEPPDTNARYKAFWIFGDGTFKFHEDINKASDLASHSETHTYLHRASYKPSVVLTEKKSNTSPPQGPKRFVSVPPQAAPAWVSQIQSGSSMDIFPSGMNRPNYSTAFVVSARKEDTEISGIFFFYNSLNSGNGYAAGDLHDQFNDWSLLPDYFTNVNAGDITPRSTLTDLPAFNTFVAPFLNLKNQYKNYIFVPVDKPANGNPGLMGRIPPTFTEARFFPVLRTMWQNAWAVSTTAMPKGKYLAIAVGSEHHDPANPPDYWSGLINDVSGEISPTINQNTLEITSGNSNKLYIRGLAVSEVEMAGSIDPNDLAIISVCPKGRDQYEVTFEMKVCNSGYLEAQNFRLFLKDFTKGKLLSQPVFLIPAEAPVSEEHLPALGNNDQWDYRWNISLDGAHQPVKSNQEPESCKSTRFTVLTNWDGVSQLAQGRALQLCVFFDKAPDDCTFNLALPDGAVSQDTGYNAPPGCRIPPVEETSACDCCKPQYTTIIIIQISTLVLVLLIAWLLIRKVYPDIFQRLFGKSGRGA